MEGPRLLWTVLAMVAMGIATGEWSISIILPLLAYLAWMLYQLYSLFCWFEKGLASGSAPDGEGVWAEIVQYAYRQKAVDDKRKKRVKEMLARFHSTVSALPDATIVLNKQLEIEWANAPALLLLGVDRRRDVGQRVTNLIRNPEFRRFLGKKKSGEKKEIISPLNTQKTLLLQLVRFGKGQRLLLARDISDRVEAQLSRRAFVDNASHELKSPLTVVMGYLELMSLSDELPHELRGPVERATEQAQQMNRIIEDMLELSQAEALALARFTVEDAPLIDVSEKIHQIVDDVKTGEGGQERTFELDVSDGLKIRSSPSSVVSIVENIVGNGIKHTPKGSIIKITWQYSQQGDPCFIVTDNGSGVPTEHIPHLTERFYRVDKAHSRSAGSTGLGLAIVKHTVESIGGVFLVSPALEGGLMCVACFPRAKPL